MPSQEKIGYVNSLHVFNKNEKSKSIVRDAEYRKVARRSVLVKYYEILRHTLKINLIYACTEINALSAQNFTELITAAQY